MYFTLSSGTGSLVFSNFQGNNQVSAGRFTGPDSVALYDGTGDVPLAPDLAHWAEGTRDDGVGVAMDPQLTVGTRRLLTPLDYAGLDDIGWSMPPRAAPSLSGVSQPSTAGHEVTITYSHYAKIDTNSFQQAGDVYAVAPGGAVVPAAYARTSLSSDGTAADVTYVLAPPGGSWDAADTGTWSLVLSPNAVLSTTGEAVAFSHSRQPDIDSGCLSWQLHRYNPSALRG